MVLVVSKYQSLSADDRMLYVPRTQTVTLGPRAFSSSGPSSWNSLPPLLRDPDISLLHFRQLLKTYLFNSDTNKIGYVSLVIATARACATFSVNLTF